VFFFISVFAFSPASFIEPPQIMLRDSWPEFFHMPVIMLMLITLLNGGTLISIAYDYTEASSAPNR
jgi:H+-transporting ATPase